jgi:hypothetical protein
MRISFLSNSPWDATCGLQLLGTERNRLYMQGFVKHIVKTESVITEEAPLNQEVSRCRVS